MVMDSGRAGPCPPGSLLSLWCLQQGSAHSRHQRNVVCCYQDMGTVQPQEKGSGHSAARGLLSLGLASIFFCSVCVYVCLFRYLYTWLLWALVVGSLIFAEARGIFFFSCSLSGASQVVLVVKNPPASAGEIRDEGSIPGSGRSPGGGHGNPLQYSCLENPMDRGAWWATVHGVSKNCTRQSDWVCTHRLRSNIGTSLLVQWLKLHAVNEGGPGSTPGQRTRSHLLQLKIRIPQWRLKIPCIATNTWCSHIKEGKKKKWHI